MKKWLAIFIVLLAIGTYSYSMAYKNVYLGFGIRLNNNQAAGGGGPATDGILLETGDYLLLETGDYSLLE